MFLRIHCGANATAFVFLAIVAAASVAQERPGDPPPTTERLPNKPSQARSLVTPKTPTDVLINQIETELTTSRRLLSTEDFIRSHTSIATLIGDLRRTSPDDPHVAKYLPERWLSLKLLARLPTTDGKSSVDRMRELNAELEEVLKTTTDSSLRSDALFFQTIFKLYGPIDGPAAVTVAEKFVSEWPKDNRSAEVLHLAVAKLHYAWYLRIAVIALCVVISAVVAMTAPGAPSKTRKWLKFGILFGILGLALFALLHTLFPDLPGLRQFEAAALKLILPPVILAIRLIVEAGLLGFVGSYRFWLVIVVASTTALSLVAIRQRSGAATGRRFSKVRQLILGFVLAGALCFAVDAYVISRQSAEVTRRISQEYPDSFRGRLAQGKTRQRERVGDPFELEFTDAISGQAVSMKNMKGKVVVVDFWATWCSPCIREIPDLKRLHAEYHNQGVEFIGVSLDLPESEGGLEKLKAFVDKEQIPWPQYYLGQDNRALLTGSAVNDFSESWGIEGIPTIFLIDRSGNLYSTEAQGRLDTLIPLLLRK